MGENTKAVIGHLASAGAYTIFAFNIIICKEIANAEIVTPLALFTLRALGATILFWLFSLFIPKEKIERKDFKYILIASLLGLLIPQMTFLSAITITTTIDTSILTSLSPIMTMIIAAIFLKEPITWKKSSGVMLAFGGVLLLIFNSLSMATGGVYQTSPAGIMLMLLNSLSFALYLGVFRPLISRYHVFTFMKWMFLISLLISLPIAWHDIHSINVADLKINIVSEILYVIVFATFIAYWLIPIGQKNIRPTLVSMYSYLQPILGVIISICIGMDVLTWQKIVSVLAVFTGVALVNNSKAAKQYQGH